VSWLKLRCFVLGHEDRMQSAGGRVYLVCDECGRETHGWQLERERSSSSPRWLPPLAAFQQLAHAVWQRVTGAVRL